MITDDFNAIKTLWTIASFIVWLHIAVALAVLIGYAVIIQAVTMPTATQLTSWTDYE